jgi:hypothetical protein
MPHRRLTEGCLFALRALAEGAGTPIDIYNRTVASNLRVVERVYPEFVRIVPRASGCGAWFGAAITDRGLAFITPRKLRHAREVRA